jgi:hypothetical protein
LLNESLVRDPRIDNALNITTDGRKLATDARMLSAPAPDFPGSKVNALVENAAAIWNRTAATRGTQMIFCDLGVHPTPWGYSAYDDVIRKLVESGIPRADIATAETTMDAQARIKTAKSTSVAKSRLHSSLSNIFCYLRAPISTMRRCAPTPTAGWTGSRRRSRRRW